jgi:hypothetical protein
MPFRSDAQRGFMFVHHPEIAKRWATEYPNPGQLPRYANSSPRAKVAGALLARARPPKVGY